MQPVNFPTTPARTVEPIIPVTETAAPSGRPLLRSGELLEALVLRNSGDGNVTLQVKNTPIAAQTRVALSPGEKITVRVEQTLPDTILRIAGETELGKIGNLLRLHRSQAGAFAEWLTGAKSIIDPALIEVHAGRDAAKNALALLNLLEGVVLSMKTAENPLLVKDMMHWLGLLLERNLLKGQDKQDSLETVKALLLKLAAAIRESGPAERMQSVLTFLERGVKTLESQQIAVLLGQELDRSLVLQAACQFPTGIRMQDIFIEEEAQGPDGSKRFRALLLLSMDALGEIIAEASAGGGRLDCTLYAETSEARDFLTALAPELRNRLAAAGYQEPSVRCLLERNMAEAKSERFAEKKLFSLHAVDIRT
jgi:hypothetical protein